jgi:RNA polymerase sigma factor (sigma-70 family)
MNEFGRLLEGEIPRLQRYARALIRDPVRADDLVQSCLLRALIKKHLWEPGSNLQRWLFTILHNQSVSHVRRLAREQSWCADAEASLITGTEFDPFARLHLLDLERAIAKLPKGQREVIRLVGLYGLNYDEAARILAVPVGTIRSRLGRARATLRRFVDGRETPTAHPVRGARRCRPATGPWC